MGEITREYRKRVADRIKAERDRTGLTQKEFAKKVGIANQTYNNLENGIGSLKIEHLNKIAENCGCDMGYLLGDYENRTHEATDICKATGLSEEAVDILTLLNRWYNEDKDSFKGSIIYWNKTSICKVFLSLIDNIITSYDFDELFNGKENKEHKNRFPVSKIARYINDRMEMEHTEENEHFALLSELFEKYKDHNHILYDKDTGHTMFVNNHFTIQQDIEEELKERNYDEKEIHLMGNLTQGYLCGYYDMKKERKKDRFDIQQDFLRFMDSDYVEGENNGK